MATFMYKTVNKTGNQTYLESLLKYVIACMRSDRLI